jgi:hypothetical protein
MELIKTMTEIQTHTSSCPRRIGNVFQGLLSRGIQHNSALVRYITLCTLRQMLEAVGSVLDAAADAAQYTRQQASRLSDAQAGTAHMLSKHVAATTNGEAPPASSLPGYDGGAPLHSDAETGFQKDVALHEANVALAEEALAEQPENSPSQPRETGSCHPASPELLGSAGIAGCHLENNLGKQASPSAAGNAFQARWRRFLDRLRTAVKGRLPDLQALLALHSTLEAQMQQDAPAADEPLQVMVHRYSRAVCETSSDGPDPA